MRKNQNKIIVCGNEGSSANAEYISGELNKEFILQRKIPTDLYNKIKEIYLMMLICF